MLFQHEDAGDIEVRRVGWAEFAPWGDGYAREQMADANQNLWAAIAVKPAAGELPELIEDFSALPLMLVHGVIESCGSPGGLVGLSQRYPVLSLAEAEAEHPRAKEIDRLLGLPDEPLPEDEKARKAEEKRRAEARQALQEEHAALWLVPQDQIAAARKRSRRAFFVRTPAGLWAMRPPGADASAAYQEADAGFGQGKAGVSFCGAMRALSLACVLSPDPEQAKAAIEEYPAIPWILRGELEARSGGGKALVRVS